MRIVYTSGAPFIGELSLYTAPKYTRQMRYHVLLQRREGRMIPRWQINSAPLVVGDLRVSEARDERLRRTTLVARLLNSDFKDVVPQLKDVTLLYVNVDTMVLCGFESLADTDFAQTWQLSQDQKFLHALQWNERSKRAS